MNILRLVGDTHIRHLCVINQHQTHNKMRHSISPDFKTALK